MPWLVRNYEVMGQLVFIRDNFGNELRIGNNPLAEGPWVLAYHPSQNVVLLAQYQRMGELAFCAPQARLAKQWIAEHPHPVRFDQLLSAGAFFSRQVIPRLSQIEWALRIKNTAISWPVAAGIGRLLTCDEAPRSWKSFFLPV